MNTLETPKMTECQADCIPIQLRDVPQWVAWRHSFTQGKQKKVPISCNTGNIANVKDPASLSTFERAFDYYLGHRTDGIGFVFTENDEYCGLDLDDCRDQRGVIQPWATAIIEQMNTYTEVSPSCRGVKLFLRGKIKGKKRRTGNVEMYDQNRFFTVTGWQIEGTPSCISERQAELDVLYDSRFKSQKGGRKREGNPANLTDAQVLSLAMKAANGEKFTRLWSGDISGYRSESEADLALCNILTFYAGPDSSRVENLFAQSALGEREKWLSRADYRTRTVETAISGATEFYRPREVLTRIIQDYSRLYSTVDAEARPTAVLSYENCKRSVELAIELAGAIGNAPLWQSSFKLARCLHTIDDNPDLFEQAVQAFCEKTGQEFETFWYEFLFCWPKVLLAEGDDPLEWAKNMAKQNPHPHLLRSPDVYRAIGSIAWHLAHLLKDKPFWLPRERLAHLLGTYPMCISRVVALLERDKLIKCVDENYRYTSTKNNKAKAMEYIFIGGGSDNFHRIDVGEIYSKGDSPAHPLT